MPQEKPNEDDGPVWYNEVPPTVFFNVDKFKEGRAAIYQQKWQREILDQELDINQRQILKDQRLARIYLNPPSCRLKPKKILHKSQTAKERSQYKRDEQQKVEILARRHINQTCALYGINFRDAGGQSETQTVSSMLSSRGQACQKVRRLPPFHGPHALHVMPWETSPGRLVKKRYQVKIYRDKLAGHDLLDEESKDIKQYATTPLAVWRQHRFACPEGSDFRDLKEQVKLAKYRAMLKVMDMASDGDDVVLGTARLTSHFKPWTKKADANPDCDDFFEDKVLMAKARDELKLKADKLKASKRDAWRAKYASENEPRKRREIKAMNGETTTRGSQQRMSLERSVDSGDSKPASSQSSSAGIGENNESAENNSKYFFKKKPFFSVEEEYLEDLQSASVESRKELAKFLVPQPVGNFYPDPRADPKYAPCFQNTRTSR